MPRPILRSGTGALDRAAATLAAGGVVGLPTDTVYGLAARASDPRAVAALFALKRRPTDVAVPVLVGGWDQVAEVAGTLGPAASLLADRHWPGPLTLVVPRATRFDADLGGPGSARGTVGIRWPDHDLVESLCRRVGPLAVTSANLHGSPPGTTAAAVADAFSASDGLDVVVDGGPCDGVPSTVIECRGWSARCLRRGAVAWTSPAAAREVSDAGREPTGSWIDLGPVPPEGRG